MLNTTLPFKSPYLRGLAMSALGMIIISPDGLLIRLIDKAGMWEIIFFRLLFMGISLALILALRYRSRTVEVWSSIGKAGLFSALIMAASSLGFVISITHTTVANTLVIVATMPFMSAVLGWFLINEKVSLGIWVSIAIALAGVLMIFAESTGGGSWLGDLAAGVTAALMGLNLVVLRKARQRDMTPALCLAGFLGAGLALLFAQPSSVIAHDMYILALAGFVILPLSLALFLGGTRTVPAAEVALLALIETVLGPVWAWIGIGEAPSSMALIGGFVIIASIAVNAALGIKRQKDRTAA